MKQTSIYAFFLFTTLVRYSAAQTPPPAPVLVSPASGSSLVQPITLQWNAIIDPDGPIGSYTWQVSPTSTFGTIVAQGSTNQSLPEIPVPTSDRLSGLPNGTYFWRVSGIQTVGGATGSLQSPFSTVRSFTVTGLGTTIGTPTFTSPANLSQFHAVEFFDITWSAVPGAHYYLLEADDQASFSHPLTLTTDLIQFGTKFNAGWGNEIPNVYYRVRAVSTDGVRGLPSATLNVKIVNTAPVPPPPTLISPAAGASVSLPFTFDWSDTPNPQIAGYDLDIDDEPNFQGVVGVILVQNVSRSDYMLTEPLAPGTYFWRIRAVHRAVSGPWSAGRSFTVTAPPPTPPGLELFWIIPEPGSTNGGNPTQARVTLNMPAPAGGATVKIASDIPFAETPTSVFIPQGATDGLVTPIPTLPVPAAAVGTIRAAYGGGWQQSSLGLFPILYGVSLNADNVIGGTSLTGTIALLNPAPAGGIDVTLFSNDPSLTTVPPRVFIPAGQMGAVFNVATSPVTIPTRMVINSGTGFENYRAPQTWLTLMPAGSPPPPPSLSSITLHSSSILGGGTTVGTLTLTSPAPAGGASVWLNGSMEGQVVTPTGGITIPAGSIIAEFPITAPQVNFPNYVLIQARYGPSGATLGQLLQITPGSAGPPTLLALDVRPSQLVGGVSTKGMVGLVMPAPLGGGVVNVTSNNPAVQVPATVSIAAGNSANSFTINTSPVQMATTAQIDATAGGVTKTSFVYLGPDPNAPPALQSLTLSPISVAGGNTVQGTVVISFPAPAGGTSVTLSTNSSAAQPPAIVVVPQGLTTANFTVATSPVSSNTLATITAFFVTSTKSANLTITPGGASPPTPGTPTLVSPANGAQPAQPVTLDWNNTSNAASYEIQLDDSSNFSAPLVRSLTSTASQVSVTGLSSVQHWWRVRAKNSAGVAGNWSASGRFTPMAAPATATLTAVNVSPASVAGGNTSQGTITLSAAAPAGGALVSLTSSNAAVATVPVSVNVAAGSSNANFTVSTTTVTAAMPVTISATYNGLTRTTTLTVNAPPPPDTTPPTVSLTSPAAGATLSGSVTISASASDNVGVSRVELLVDGVLLSSDTTSPYSASWDTTTATNGAHVLAARAFDAANNQATSTAVNVTVNNGAPAALDITLSGVPNSIPPGQFFTATASVANTGGAAATGYSVLVNWTPSNAMRLDNPQNSTQSVASIPAGGSQGVSWRMRADNQATATLTMTLRNASGQTVDTVSKTFTITN
jgi:hypothetical protein